MSTSNAQAKWHGTIKDGSGTMKFTGYEGTYSFTTRFEDAKGTNPEELVGAAHAGCFSMYLSLLLTQEGLNPESIETEAKVTLGKDDIGPNITEIKLDCKVKCDGLNENRLKELAQLSKENCPISRLYSGGTATISADAQLLNK